MHTEIETLRVPVSLLFSKEVTASVKLVWMALQLDAHLEERVLLSPTRLATRTGLSRPTIRRAIAKLVALGWYERPSAGKVPAKLSLGPKVSITCDLITDTRMSAQARVVYGALQATPYFHRAKGKFSYASLGRLMNLGVKAVKRAARQLAHMGWIEVKQANKMAPIYFRLCNPVAAEAVAEVLRIQRRLNRAKYFGEALMREILSLSVDSREFQDGATPDILANSATGGSMELDRFYYRHNVAFEFNGPQHYHPTERFTAEEVAEQQRRDQLKRQICKDNRVKLITVHPEDLSLHTMRQFIGKLLPLRKSPIHRKTIRYLELKSRNYRRIAERGWARADQGQSAQPGSQQQGSP